MKSRSMELVYAKEIAAVVVERLRPYCDRVEIAGSVRRRRPTVGDIEIVCIPSTVPSGLFLDETVRHPGFILIVDGYERIKGDAVEGLYMQRLHPSGIKLDIFTARPETWGVQFAIRTGSAAFSKNVLAATWSRRGYKSKGGLLHIGGTPVPIYEERDLFDLLELDYVEPKDRH